MVLVRAGARAALALMLWDTYQPTYLSTYLPSSLSSVTYTDSRPGCGCVRRRCAEPARTDVDQGACVS